MNFKDDLPETQKEIDNTSEGRQSSGISNDKEVLSTLE